MTLIDTYDWPLIDGTFLLFEEEVQALGGGTAAGEIPARGTRVEPQQKHIL